MSTVRMCDYRSGDGVCGTIFSEAETGWSTGTMTVVGEDGEMRTERADFCPDHSPRKGRRADNYPRYTAPRPALAEGSQDAKDWSASSGEQQT